MSMVTQADQKAQARGQFLADAAAGIDYLVQLKDHWYQQGYNHYSMGGAWNKIDLFTPEHQQGYLDALRGVRVVFGMAGAPALNREVAV